MEVSREDWEAMASRVELLAEIASEQTGHIRWLTEMVGRLSDVMARQSGTSMTATETMVMTMDRMERNEEAMAAMAQIVLNRPMPGEPSSN